MTDDLRTSEDREMHETKHVKHTWGDTFERKVDPPWGTSPTDEEFYFDTIGDKE